METPVNELHIQPQQKIKSKPRKGNSRSRIYSKSKNAVFKISSRRFTDDQLMKNDIQAMKGVIL
jgi:hypothetical protein